MSTEGAVLGWGLGGIFTVVAVALGLEARASRKDYNDLNACSEQTPEQFVQSLGSCGGKFGVIRGVTNGCPETMSRSNMPKNWIMAESKYEEDLEEKTEVETNIMQQDGSNPPQIVGKTKTAEWKRRTIPLQTTVTGEDNVFVTAPDRPFAPLYIPQLALTKNQFWNLMSERRLWSRTPFEDINNKEKKFDRSAYNDQLPEIYQPPPSGPFAPSSQSSTPSSVPVVVNVSNNSGANDMKGMLSHDGQRHLGYNLNQRWLQRGISVTAIGFIHRRSDLTAHLVLAKDENKRPYMVTTKSLQLVKSETQQQANQYRNGAYVSGALAVIGFGIGIYCGSRR